MDELLDHLNMTAKVDCQEAQRAVLATTNGLAALDIIDNDTNGAAEKVYSPPSLLPLFLYNSLIFILLFYLIHVAY